MIKLSNQNIMAGVINTGESKNSTTGESKDSSTVGTKPTDGVKPGTPTKGEPAPSKSVFGDSKSAEMKSRVAQISAANSGSNVTPKRTGQINNGIMGKIGKSYQLPSGMGPGVKFGKK